jgi:hypothetical protein
MPRVKALQYHTYNDKVYQAGDIYEADEALGEQLRVLQFAELAEAAPTEPPPPTPPPGPVPPRR